MFTIRLVEETVREKLSDTLKTVTSVFNQILSVLLRYTDSDYPFWYLQTLLAIIISTHNNYTKYKYCTNT